MFKFKMRAEREKAREGERLRRSVAVLQFGREDALLNNSVKKLAVSYLRFTCERMISLETTSMCLEL